jgi:hypothetical protein
MPLLLILSSTRLDLPFNALATAWAPGREGSRSPISNNITVARLMPPKKREHITRYSCPPLFQVAPSPPDVPSTPTPLLSNQSVVRSDMSIKASPSARPPGRGDNRIFVSNNVTCGSSHHNSPRHHLRSTYPRRQWRCRSSRMFEVLNCSLKDRPTPELLVENSSSHYFQTTTDELRQPQLNHNEPRSPKPPSLPTTSLHNSPSTPIPFWLKFSHWRPRLSFNASATARAPDRGSGNNQFQTLRLRHYPTYYKRRLVLE